MEVKGGEGRKGTRLAKGGKGREEMDEVTKEG